MLSFSLQIHKQLIINVVLPFHLLFNACVVLIPIRYYEKLLFCFDFLGEAEFPINQLVKNLLQIKLQPLPTEPSNFIPFHNLQLRLKTQLPGTSRRVPLTASLPSCCVLGISDEFTKESVRGKQWIFPDIFGCSVYI